MITNVEYGMCSRPVASDNALRLDLSNLHDGVPKITRVRVGRHYLEKHAHDLNDELILELVTALK